MEVDLEVHTIGKSKGLWKVNKTLFRKKGTTVDGDVVILPECHAYNPMSNKYLTVKRKEEVFNSYKEALDECEERNILLMKTTRH